MISSFDDLDFSDFNKLENYGEKWKSVDDRNQAVQKYLEGKMDISFENMIGSLKAFLQDNAHKIIPTYRNIAPFDDYAEMIDGEVAMTNFLRDEASKPEHWIFRDARVCVPKKMPQMLELGFRNKAVNDGESLEGLIFLGVQGKIKHIIIQNTDPI